MLLYCDTNRNPGLWRSLLLQTLLQTHFRRFRCCKTLDRRLGCCRLGLRRCSILLGWRKEVDGLRLGLGLLGCSVEPGIKKYNSLEHSLS